MMHMGVLFTIYREYRAVYGWAGWGMGGFLRKGGCWVVSCGGGYIGVWVLGEAVFVFSGAKFGGEG